MQGFNHWLDELTLNAGGGSGTVGAGSMSPVSNGAQTANGDTNMINGLQVQYVQDYFYTADCVQYTYSTTLATTTVLLLVLQLTVYSTRTVLL